MLGCRVRHAFEWSAGPVHSGWRRQALPTAQATQCSAVHWRSLSWSVQLEREGFSNSFSNPSPQVLQ